MDCFATLAMTIGTVSHCKNLMPDYASSAWRISRRKALAAATT